MQDQVDTGQRAWRWIGDGSAGHSGRTVVQDAAFQRRRFQEAVLSNH